MGYTLVAFHSVPLAAATFDHDSGFSAIGFPTTYQGRDGIGFALPDELPNAQGGRVRLTPEDPAKVPIEQRGIVFLKAPGWESSYPWADGQTAALAVDDFYFQDGGAAPTPTPPDHPQQPIDIIRAVYAAGDYNLVSPIGCGMFTEDACKALHEQHNLTWGHVRKDPGQNQFNGHAIDAVQILVATEECPTGTYDIIKGAEAPGAEPAFNRVDNVHPDLWYYPAAPLEPPTKGRGRKH